MTLELLLKAVESGLDSFRSPVAEEDAPASLWACFLVVLDGVSVLMGQIGGAVELLRVPVLKIWAGLFSAAARLSRTRRALACDTPERVSLSRFSLGLCSGVLDLRRVPLEC